MRETRRMKRLERNNKNRQVHLNLIPMLDVLSVLMFFLLFHSFNGDLPEQRITLPSSIVDTKPRGTVVIAVTNDAVMVQGEAVMKTADLVEDAAGTVPEITQRLGEIDRSLAEAGVESVAGEGKEITLLAEKTIPFTTLKKIMTTCTASGYGKISLAVAQKAAQG